MSYELCAKCPMKDERYTPTDQALKIEISQLKMAIEDQRDFIEFLFDHSEHCDHITYKEAWEEFTEWQNRDWNPQASVATDDDSSNADDKQNKVTQ